MKVRLFLLCNGHSNDVWKSTGNIYHLNTAKALKKAVFCGINVTASPPIQ